MHYRFLSAYVHATATGYDYVDPGRAGLFLREEHWHAVTELALLYVCSVGISELRSFVEFADRRPKLILDNRTEITEACSKVSELTAYLWYPRSASPPTTTTSRRRIASPIAIEHQENGVRQQSTLGQSR